MISDIVDGISKAIYAEFGDVCSIYTESVEQGLEEPCFFITCLTHASTIQRSSRYKKSISFIIQYLTSNDEPKRECLITGERLYKCLEYIDVGEDLVRGTNISMDVIDSILNFKVDYDIFTIVKSEVDEMASYSTKTNIKEG